MTFARTKIQPPRPRASYVERGALHDRLAAALRTRRVVLLCAPAGYGKTMLLAHEAARCPAGSTERHPTASPPPEPIGSAMTYDADVGRTPQFLWTRQLHPAAFSVPHIPAAFSIDAKGPTMRR